MLKIDKNRKYLLACSNGPDSMALFYLLLKEGYHFSVAHVNYHLRKESNLEEAKLREYCCKNNIDLYVKHCLDPITKNIEEECRNIRYDFFNSVSKNYKFDAILVAHHQDDLIETYLLQKNRQNIPNFFGISDKTIINDCEIVRPLLPFKKKELLDICVKNNVPYSIDSSNLSDQYERNKIRHKIVEKLSEQDRSKLLEEIKAKNIEFTEYKNNVDRVKDNTILSINSLNDIELAMYLTKIGKNYIKNIEISKHFVKEIRKQMLSKKSCLEIKVKDNIFICKEYDKLNFRDLSEISYSYTLKEPSTLDTQYFCLDFRSDASDRNVHKEDYPITITNAKKTDKYVINGYSCSVRRLFIDWKMPKYLRLYWPVIKNKDGLILYIPRYQSSFVENDLVNFYVK